MRLCSVVWEGYWETGWRNVAWSIKRGHSGEWVEKDTKKGPGCKGDGQKFLLSHLQEFVNIAFQLN